MIGIFVAIFSFFAGASANLMDRFILTKRIADPLVYVFYVGIMNVGAFVLLPYSFFDISLSEGFVYLVVGFISFVAILSYNYAFSLEEATKVAPVVIGFVPAFSLFYSIYFLDQALSRAEIFAFILLLVGSVLLAFDKKTFSLNSQRAFFLAVFTAFFLAVYAASFKYALSIRGDGYFWGVFFWTRIATLVSVLPLLFFKRVRESIFGHADEKVVVPQKTKIRTILIVIGTKSIGALSSVSLNYAFSLVNVALINSMAGLQFGFLFIMALFLSKKYPDIITEASDKKTIFRKAVSLAIMCVGIIILATQCSSCYGN
jgi:drug/metabolite transporter (DMT)-like permease